LKITGPSDVIFTAIAIIKKRGPNRTIAANEKTMSKRRFILEYIFIEKEKNPVL
jgi:hypothetical protein